MTRTVAVAALAAALLLPATAGAVGPLGALSQLAGNPGCYTDDGNAVPSTPASGACTNVRATHGGYGGAVSPDGKSLYFANNTNGIAVFSRDLASGALTQLVGTPGCVTDD